MVDRDHQAREDMFPCACLFQFILRSAGHNALLMLNIIGKHRLDAHLHGASVRNRNHIDAERHLQVRVFIKHRKNRHWIDIALDFNHSTQTRSVRLIADIINSAELCFAFLAELENLFKHRRLRHLIRHFRDNDELAPCRAILNMHLRTQSQLAASGFISIANFVVSNQPPACREIRRGQDLHDFIERRFRLVHHQNRRINRFLQVMRRNIRCQTDRNTGCAVDQQIRIA